MKFQSSVAAGALLLSTVSAHPAPVKRQDIDTTILQFALTLEHLENVFYKQALSMMPESDFVAAGYPEPYYSNLKYISHDEESHVEVLSSAIMAAGATPVAPCTYDFGFTDVKSFITLSSVLEGVGTSAYLGAAGLITSKAYLTVAGSILVTEALHTSMQRMAVGEVPAANPYYTPLDPMSVYTLAASFITACPASNAPLPFMAFPTLMATQGMPGAPDMTFTFSTEATVASGAYLTFVNGLAVESVMATMAGGMLSAAIPMDVSGQTYVFVTSSAANGTLMDSMVVAGPAIIEVTPPAPSIDFSES